MTWSPEKAPASPALVWEDAVVGEQTYEPRVQWSIFTGQHPQGQEGRDPSDVSHSEALEVLGASDNPSRPGAHIPGTWQPLFLLTHHHRQPFPPEQSTQLGHQAGGTTGSLWPCPSSLRDNGGEQERGKDTAKLLPG